MKTTFLIVLTGIAFVGCAGPIPSRQQALTYPYVASPERQAEILGGMDQIKTGMAPSDAERCLGKPDEIRKLYDRIKTADPVGYTWWYIIERQAASGSVVEKAEKLVRVSFNLKDRVTRVDSWGIENKSDNN